MKNYLFIIIGLLIVLLIIIAIIVMMMMKKEDYKCKEILLDKRNYKSLIERIFRKKKTELIANLNKMISTTFDKNIYITPNCYIKNLKDLFVSNMIIDDCDDENICTNMNTICKTDDNNMIIVNTVANTTFNLQDNIIHLILYEFADIQMEIKDLVLFLTMEMQINKTTWEISLTDLNIQGYKQGVISFKNYPGFQSAFDELSKAGFNITSILSEILMSVKKSILPFKLTGNYFDDLDKKILSNPFPDYTETFNLKKKYNFYSKKQGLKEGDDILQINYSTVFQGLISEFFNIGIQYFTKFPVPTPPDPAFDASKVLCEDVQKCVNQASFINQIFIGCMKGSIAYLDPKNHSNGYINICSIKGLEKTTIDVSFSGISQISEKKYTIVINTALNFNGPEIQTFFNISGGFEKGASVFVNRSECIHDEIINGIASFYPKSRSTGNASKIFMSIIIDCTVEEDGTVMTIHKPDPDKMIYGDEMYVDYGADRCIKPILEAIRTTQSYQDLWTKITNKVLDGFLNGIKTFINQTFETIASGPIKIPIFFLPQYFSFNDKLKPVEYSAFVDLIQDKDDSANFLDLKTCKMNNPSLDITIDGSGRFQCITPNPDKPVLYYDQEIGNRCRNIYYDENDDLHITYKNDDMTYREYIGPNIKSCITDTVYVYKNKNNNLIIECASEKFKYNILTDYNVRNIIYAYDQYGRFFTLNVSGGGSQFGTINKPFESFQCFSTFYFGNQMYPTPFAGTYYPATALYATTAYLSKAYPFTFYMLKAPGTWIPALGDTPEEYRMIILEDNSNGKHLFVNANGDAYSLEYGGSEQPIIIENPDQDLSKYMYNVSNLPGYTPGFTYIIDGSSPYFGDVKITDIDDIITITFLCTRPLLGQLNGVIICNTNACGDTGFAPSTKDAKKTIYWRDAIVNGFSISLTDYNASTTYKYNITCGGDEVGYQNIIIKRNIENAATYKPNYVFMFIIAWVADDGEIDNYAPLVIWGS